MYEVHGNPKKSWYLGFYESSRWISVPIQYEKLFRIRNKSFWNQKCQFRFEIGPFKPKYVSYSSGFLRKPQKFDEISQLISRVVEVRLLNIRSSNDFLNQGGWWLAVEWGAKYAHPGLKRINSVRNHVKLLHVYKSGRGFSKGTVLCGGYKLWAWQISWELQTCIAERSKVPNG